MTMGIILKEITTVKERVNVHRFITSLYEDYPCWVPPLWSEELNSFNPKTNPALEFCTTKSWTAWKEGKLAGTITAIINQRFIDQWKQKNGRFGWFECIHDQEVAHALLDQAENWCLAQGMEALVGPMGFTDFDKEGLLVEGHQEMSTFAMLYNPPWYQKLVESEGFEKEVDWIEFRVKVPEAIPEKVLRVMGLVMKRQKVHLLESRRKKDLVPYIPQVFDLLAECYKDLYGYVTLTEKMTRSLTKEYITLIDHRLTKVILDEEDRVIACGICMPSFSEAMRKAKGRLFPLGIFFLLKAMKKPQVLDMYLVAVKPEYQKRGIMSVLMSAINQEAIKLGIKEAETLAELEDNLNVQTLWKSYDARQHKRRRVYRKTLI